MQPQTHPVFLPGMAIFLGVGLVILDSTIVNVALPVMAHDLHISDATATWFVLCYQIAVLALLFPAIALSSLLGSKRIFLWGIALFVLASLGCALSRSAASLCLFRIMQAIGGAGMLSVNIALVERVFKGPALATGIGFNTATISLAIIAGPALAGAILMHASWPWLFSFNIPLGIAAFLAAARCVPGESPPVITRHDVRSTLALLGISLLLFAGFFGALGVFSWGFPVRSLSWFLFLLLVSWWMLVHHQRQGTVRLLPDHVLGNWPFMLSLACTLFCFIAQSATVLAMPFLFMEGLDFSIAETSLLLIAWPALHSIASVGSGRLSRLVSRRILVPLGIFLCTTGILLLALVPAPSLERMATIVALCGLGYGLFQAPNETATLMYAAEHDRARTSSLVSFTRTFGQTLGSMLTAGCLLWYPGSYNIPFLCAAAAGSIGIALTLLRSISIRS